jgi:hypothetical protein
MTPTPDLNLLQQSVNRMQREMSKLNRTTRATLYKRGQVWGKKKSNS